MAQMEITTVIGCRVQCLFCPQILLMNKYQEQNNTKEITWGEPEIMSFETFKTCIDKIPISVNINFSGFAEPWLNPDCSKMLVYAHRKGHKISVYSTLVGMTIDDVEQWKNIPFEKFEIHLPDTQKYAKIALNKQYIELLEKIISSNIHNLTCMTMGDIPNEIQDIIKTNFSPNKMIDRAGNSEFGEKTPKKYGPLYCRRANNKMVNTLDSNVLVPNGDVSLCCMDYGLDYILGNLTETDYYSLFNSNAANKILQKMHSNDAEIMCRYCNDSVSMNLQKNILSEQFSEDSKKQFDENKYFLNNLYNKLLMRDADEEGLNYFIPLLMTKKITQDDVRKKITESDEYKHILTHQKQS